MVSAPPSGFKMIRPTSDWALSRTNKPCICISVALLTILILAGCGLQRGGYAGFDLAELMVNEDFDTLPNQATDSAATLLPPKAVIIETHVFPQLIPIITHFAAVLGPSWGIILFTLETNWTEPTSAPFQRLRQDGRLEVRFLPARILAMTDTKQVSDFLATPWLWEQLADFERIFMFQSDSMICANSEQKVDDWLKWDMVGAPINPAFPARGYNGGLGIRNPRAMLNITQTVDFATSGVRDEDQFFFGELEKSGALLPSIEEAMHFSVETIFFDRPLGYHQYTRWLSAHQAEIEEWCPEIKLATARRAIG